MELTESSTKSGGSISTSFQREQVLNPWPYLNKYVEFVSKSRDKLVFKCKLCLPKMSTIKAHVSSLSNLKQHVKRAHPAKYAQFVESVRTGSTRGRPKSMSKPPLSTVDSDVDSVGSGSSNSFSPSAKIRLCQQSNGKSVDIIAGCSGISEAEMDRCISNFFKKLVPTARAVSPKMEYFEPEMNGDADPFEVYTQDTRPAPIPVKEEVIPSSVPQRNTDCLLQYLQRMEPKTSTCLFLQSLEEDMEKLSSQSLRKLKLKMLSDVQKALEAEGKDDL